jgi:hypothetical protein
MPGIKPAILDVLTRLSVIQAVNQDNQTLPLYTRIFNNQIKRQLDGKINAYQLPAAFIEVIKPSNFNRLLNGVSESDIIFRIHLQHWFTDAQDGTFDQDLPIYDLRDAVIANLSDFRPTACGNLCLTAESQDYNHDDVYVYLIEFTTGFIDSKGSKYDPGQPYYINSNPPTALDLIVNNSETVSYPDFALGYYVIYNTDPFWNNTTRTWGVPYLKGKTGYAIYSTQLSDYLSQTQDVDVHYDLINGTFGIIIPGFVLIDGESLIVYPNKYDISIP